MNADETRNPDATVSHDPQAPLLELRDGVEALEAFRRGSGVRLAPQLDDTPTGFYEVEPTPFEDESSLPLPDAARSGEMPFRFVHGYTLPKHWAKREREVTALCKAVQENTIRVLALVAIGGTGKSALTRKLLDDLPQHGVFLDGALWFSFYVEPEFDRFLAEACRYLIPGFDPQAHPSPHEKSVLLREALEKGHYLLVMDGIEVLLVADKNRRDYGAFQDRALREFLEGMCQSSQSQAILSSRFPLTDLDSRLGFSQVILGDLTSDSADSLLDSYGITHDSEARVQLYTRYGTHALTLQLLGDYLARYHFRDVSGIQALRPMDASATQGVKIQSILEGYWERFSPEEQFFFVRLSAFRGGVDERAMIVLNRKGEAPTADFREMVQRLMESPLLNVERRQGHPRLTSHPLVKTFFYERMGEKERSQTHRALKDYAQGLPLPERPRTLEDYEPLLEACHHCLQVGLYTEAYQIYRRNNMDNALRWWGHFTQAASLLEPLREASMGEVPAWQSEWWQRSWVENETALLATLQGDTAKALERFQHSIEMDVRTGDRPGESATWQNLASLRAQCGDFRGALQALERSRVIETLLNRLDKEDILLGVEGYCRAEVGDIQNGFDLLQRALETSKARANQRAICYWNWRLGDLMNAAGKLERGREYHLQAWQLARQEQFRDYEGHALRGLGDVALRAKDFHTAHTHYTDALRLGRTLGNPYLIAETLLAMARLAEREGQLSESEDLASQALEDAQECGYRPLETGAYLLLARCARAAQDTEKTQERLAAAYRLIEETRHAATYQEYEQIRRG